MRDWVFTLNNPHETISERKFTGCTYLVSQLERGASGTLHYQGYVEFKEKKTINDLKRYLPGAHFEPRRGSQQQAIDYCKKASTRTGEAYEWGNPKKQGKRTDLEEIRQRIIEGWSNKDVADGYFGSWCRYNRSFMVYKNLIQPVRTWKPEVFLLYGPPGTGKSRYALESGPADQQYWKQRSIWWDLYEAHETVVLDDYYGWLPWDVLLRILDRYPLLVETKGGQVQFLPKKIYITSNSKPEEWYKESPNLAALKRRIDHFIWFKTDDYHIEVDWDFISNLKQPSTAQMRAYPQIVN